MRDKLKAIMDLFSYFVSSVRRRRRRLCRIYENSNFHKLNLTVAHIGVPEAKPLVYLLGQHEAA